MKESSGTAEKAVKNGKKTQKKQERVKLFPANKKGYHKMPLMDFLRAVFYPIHALLYPFKLHGYKKVGPGPYIYVGNHYCLWDVFFPAHTTVMDAMRVLKNGEKISMFPEGTRNKTGSDEFLPFHGGSALLAIKTKTPVIPFVICTPPRFLRRTHVVFGEPMELSEYYDRKLTQADYEEAEEKLKARLYELRANFRAEQAAKKKRKK